MPRYPLQSPEVPKSMRENWFKRRRETPMNQRLVERWGHDTKFNRWSHKNKIAMVDVFIIGGVVVALLVVVIVLIVITSSNDNVEGASLSKEELVEITRKSAEDEDHPCCKTNWLWSADSPATEMLSEWSSQREDEDSHIHPCRENILNDPIYLGNHTNKLAAWGGSDGSGRQERAHEIQGQIRSTCSAMGRGGPGGQ